MREVRYVWRPRISGRVALKAQDTGRSMCLWREEKVSSRSTSGEEARSDVQEGFAPGGVDGVGEVGSLGDRTTRDWENQRLETLRGTGEG